MKKSCVAVAALAIALSAGIVSAQTRDLRGPAELPPPSFKGQQYVDSRGCIFLRAGLNGAVNWVPRVSRSNGQVCGQSRGGPIDVATTAPAPARQAPAMQVQTGTYRQPQVAVIPQESYVPPRAVIAPSIARTAPVYVQPQTPRAGVTVGFPQQGKQEGRRNKIDPTPAGNCFAEFPVLETFTLQGGGQTRLCTRGDGDFMNSRPPRVGANGGFGANGARYADNGAYAAVRVDAPIYVPQGYKPAWQDDRLNPSRGLGTVQGWQDQWTMWTPDTPAEMPYEVRVRPSPDYALPEHLFMRSSKSEPVVVTRSTKGETAYTAPVASGSFVQVGSFGQAGNAARAAARLEQMGLPVTMTQSRGLQVVMAGPFASASDLQAALGAARQAGFGDAFIR